MAQKTERHLLFEEGFFSLLAEQHDLVLQVPSLVSCCNKLQHRLVAFFSRDQKQAPIALLLNFIAVKQHQKNFFASGVQTIRHRLIPTLGGSEITEKLLEPRQD